MRAALGLGSRSNSVKIARTCGTVRAGIFPPQPQPLQLQEPQRQRLRVGVIEDGHGGLQRKKIYRR